MNRLLFVLPNLHAEFRNRCLEIVLTRIDTLENVYVELKSKGLLAFLTHRSVNFVKEYACTCTSSILIVWNFLQVIYFSVNQFLFEMLVNGFMYFNDVVCVFQRWWDTGYCFENCQEHSEQTAAKWGVRVTSTDLWILCQSQHSLS